MDAKSAAMEIGIPYSRLMARIRKGKIKATKLGWSTLVSKKEVAKAKAEELKNDNNKNLEETTR